MPRKKEKYIGLYKDNFGEVYMIKDYFRNRDEAFKKWQDKGDSLIVLAEDEIDSIRFWASDEGIEEGVAYGVLSEEYD